MKGTLHHAIRILFITAITLLFIACEHTLNQNERVINPARTTHIIPPDIALGHLYDLLGHTKSEFEIESFYVIKSQAQTKASTSDTLLYLVNFTNDEGYAVLAADKRIVEDILILADTGNVMPDALYPTDIPLIQDTIDYYNEEYDDYYIGGDPALAENFILRKIHQYAMNQTSNNTWTSDRDDDFRTDGGGQPLDRYPIRTNFKRVEQMVVNAMMKTQWSQGEPYNSHIPYGKPAGCVPIAIAQILTYNKYPENLKINNIFIDWDFLGSTKYVTPNTPEAYMVGTLLRDIQDHCLSLRTHKWTFTLPSLAADYLRRCGYKNVELKLAYDESLLFSTLLSDTPVFLAGVENYCLKNSHGWVVDGWKKVFEQYDLVDKYTGNYISSGSELLFHLVHCNWGNDKTAWVASGVFYDGYSMYDSMYRMITYSKPQL